ncbi:MAG: BRCT domain-containing protein [Lentisphaeraceae bacterium]|nr:BRCT domain-containing protein [Lentisphaeraceae bacterium]
MPSNFKNSKKAHEFVGLCLGVLADKKLVTEEVEYLRSWLRKNPDVAGSYPVRGLFIRICEMLEDNKIDAAEERELLDHLYELTSTKNKSTTKTKQATSKFKASFSEPVPAIKFPGKKFYLHGQFIIGTRDWLNDIVIQNGGSISEHVCAETDYCIIGAMAELSTLVNPPAGICISQLPKVHIVPEEYWSNHLFR